MLKKFSAIIVVMAAVALLGSTARAAGLIVGDPAPKLTVKQFVKGAPVPRLEKGKVYVVEFWATWCGPCKESIPHLTEMAKKNKAVTFVGVSVWEDDQKKVAPFVAKMGDQMNYHVAMDIVPSGKDPHKGAMSVNWMGAAEQDGIPTAFIINKEGRVAWIGHPMEMEEPLAKIVAGRWDLKAAAAKSRQEMVLAQKLHALQEQLEPILKKDKLEKSDYAKIVSLMDAAIAKNPEIEEPVALHKIDMLELQGKSDAAAAYITRLVGGVFKDNTKDLVELTLAHIAPDAPDPTPAILAAILKAAQRADVIAKGKDAGLADLLAAVYFANGNTAKAVETQERALQVAKGTKYEKEPSLQEHLTKYKAGK